MEVIEQMLAKYPRRTDVDITHAMREVIFQDPQERICCLGF